jgi:hypothetical protein
MEKDNEIKLRTKTPSFKPKSGILVRNNTVLDSI